MFRLTVPRVAGQQLIGSPLPLGPDEAEPGPELVRSPLVRQLDDVIQPAQPASGFAATDRDGPAGTGPANG